MNSINGITETKISFFKNRNTHSSFLLALVLDIIIWIYLFLKIGPQENPVYLHYNIYFGVDLIGAWYWIYYLPALGLFILLVNFIIAQLLYRRMIIFSYLVQWLTLFLEIILLIAALLIVRQNL